MDWKLFTEPSAINFFLEIIEYHHFLSLLLSQPIEKLGYFKAPINALILQQKGREGEPSEAF